MIRLTRFVVCCALLGICPGSIHVRADDEKREGPRAESEGPDREKQAQHQELERKMAELQRRIAELRAANKPDEAAELERDAKNLILKLRSAPERHALDALRKEIEELRKTGRHDEAAKLELHLREVMEQEKRVRASAEEQEHRAREPRERNERAVREGKQPHEAGPEDLERRLNHLREAAENLVAAGLHEQAEQLRRQADLMRAKFGEHPGQPPELQELHNQLRQQNERIERLEQIVNKLLQQSATSAATPAAKIADAKIDKRLLAFAETVIKKYDKNGDGALSQDEWAGMSRKPSAADKDGDGKMTATEYAMWMASNGPVRPAEKE